MDGLITLTEVTEAVARVAHLVHRTPVLTCATLGELVGADLRLKAELFQKTGSFKPRGVLNRILTLSDADRQRGLITLSAGNAAAAVAYGARAVGTTGTVVMPATAVASKVAATKAYGGDVVLTDGALLDECLRIRDERGLTLVHPFADREVIAGHGGVGVELVEDVPNVVLVLVPVGGGGLLGGVATAVKGLRSGARVVGVEPVGASIVSQSLAAGEPVSAPVSSVADGLCAPFTTETNLDQIRAYVDDVVTVDDEAIVEAQRLLASRAKLAAEPSGAAGLAALLAGAVTAPTGVTVVIVSGGNTA